MMFWAKHDVLKGSGRMIITMTALITITNNNIIFKKSTREGKK